jgi:hypothetical protein
MIPAQATRRYILSSVRLKASQELGRRLAMLSLGNINNSLQIEIAALD